MTVQSLDYRMQEAKLSPAGSSAGSPHLFWIAVLLLALLPALFIPRRVEAQTRQIEQPDRKYLFLEDKHRKEKDKRRKELMRQRKKAAEGSKTLGQQLPFDINAKSLSYDSSGNVINAEGDVIITYSSLIAEAQRGKVNIQTNQAELSGDVRISDVSSNIVADAAHVNLEDGTAQLDNADVRFSEGDYRVRAKKARREKGEAYTLEKTVLTTCQCPEDDECMPWSLHADEARITQNGYGQAWNAALDVHDVPVFYFPYLLFPAKTERQSGFLPAQIGGGRQDGLDLNIPFFLVIDDSADMTISGVYESNVRFGSELELRKISLYDNRIELGGVYLNESARNGDLLGTNTEGLYDPTIGTNRYGAYANHSWKMGAGTQYLMRGRYVSDDLFLREYDYEDIAPYNSRFVTSTAVLRSPLGNSFSADLSAEYNQSLVSDQDLVFQRAPELNITGMNSLNIFGENPLGMKLVATHNLSSVYFSRIQGYEGARSEIYEKLKMPFHVRNYFDGSIEGNVRASEYNLTKRENLTAADVTDPNQQVDFSETGQRFPGTSDRLVPGFNATLGTAVEKVFEVSEGNWIKELAELGTSGREEKLVRLKHTIEPFTKYKYVPSVNQEDNPQFDSVDHLAQRDVVTYGITQRLYARFDPRNEYIYGIEETAPELSDISSIQANNPLDEKLTFGFEEETNSALDDYQSLRQGSIGELATLKVYQSYDFLKASSNDLTDPTLNDPLSDITGDLTLYPNEHVVLRNRIDYNPNDSTLRAYTVEGQLTSKRGDSLRARLRDVSNPGSTSNLRQLETSLELKLTEFTKLGYYSRYDDLNSEFIEQKGGLRFFSSCRCWVFDLMVSEKLNPDQTKFIFNITLVGLGEVGNTFFSAKQNQNSQ